MGPVATSVMTAITEMGRAVKQLRKNLTFVVFVIIILSLGIGANTAVFRVVNAVLLKSIAVSDPGSLYFVQLFGAHGDGGNGGSYPWLRTIQKERPVGVEITGYQFTPLQVTINGNYQSVHAQFVAGNFFRLLKVPALLGRTISEEDDSIESQGGVHGPVAVITYAFWISQFGKRPDILGRPVQTQDRTALIIGVLPPEYTGPEPERPVDMFLPLTLASPGARRNPAASWLRVVARVSDPRQISALRASLEAHLKRFCESRHIPMLIRTSYLSRVSVSRVSRGLSSLRARFSLPLWCLLLLTGLMLITACCALGCLYLARVIRKRSDLTIRRMLGATRSRLLAQMVFENSAPIVLGTASGVWLSNYVTAALTHRFLGAGDQYVIHAGLDRQVVLFVAGLAAGVCLLFSIAPAIWVTHFREDRGLIPTAPFLIAQYGWLNRALLTVQMAFSILLLTAAGLLVATLHNLSRNTVGFRPQGIALLRLQLDPKRYSPEQLPSVWRSMLDTVGHSEPSIVDVSLSTTTPIGTQPFGSVLLSAVDGFSPAGDRDMEVLRNEVSASYFGVMRMHPLVGRFLRAEDTEHSPKVVVVNRACAQFYFHSDIDAVGKKMCMGSGASRSCYEVVGVVGNATQTTVRAAPRRELYFPLAQGLEDNYDITLAALTTRPPEHILTPLQKAVRNHFPGILVQEATTLQRDIDNSIQQERTLAELSTIFSVLAVLIVGAGLYAVALQDTSQRVAEIGLRMALGASQSQIAKLFASRLFVIVGIGVASGTVVAVFFVHAVRSILFGVTGLSTLAIVASVAVLILIACMATVWPIWRAMRVDPSRALRVE